VIPVTKSNLQWILINVFVNKLYNSMILLLNLVNRVQMDSLEIRIMEDVILVFLLVKLAKL